MIREKVTIPVGDNSIELVTANWLPSNTVLIFSKDCNNNILDVRGIRLGSNGEFQWHKNLAQFAAILLTNEDDV